jgi:hypothetical protein
MPPTTEEIECIAEEAEENGISQAVEELLATTTKAGRKRKPRLWILLVRNWKQKKSKRGGKK